MTLHHYKQLSEAAQYDALEQSGVLISERKVAFSNIRLYQINDFYVELYRHEHFNVITKTKSFANPALLTPYLESIDIDALLCVIGL